MHFYSVLICRKTHLECLDFLIKALGHSWLITGGLEQ